MFQIYRSSQLIERETRSIFAPNIEIDHLLSNELVILKEFLRWQYFNCAKQEDRHQDDDQ